MKKIVYLLLAVVLVALPLVAACKAAPSPAPTGEPIVLKALSFYAPGTPSAWPIETFIEQVNERAKGELIIKYLGSTEVVPSPQMGPAVATGVIDVLMHAPGWMDKPLGVPIIKAGQFRDTTKILPYELREMGFVDFMNPVYQQANLFLMGPAAAYLVFNLFINVRVKTLDDFNGLKLRAPPDMVPVIEALGAVPISVPFPEVYTAMERGTVIGFISTITGFVPQKHWNEVTKYTVREPVSGAEQVIVVNLDAWNRLPEHLQKIMIDTQIELEQVGLPAHYRAVVELDERLMIDAGVEFIDISPPGALTELSLRVLWDNMIEVEPELGPKLRELMTK